MKKRNAFKKILCFIFSLMLLLPGTIYASTANHEEELGGIPISLSNDGGITIARLDNGSTYNVYWTVTGILGASFTVTIPIEMTASGVLGDGSPTLNAIPAQFCRIPEKSIFYFSNKYGDVQVTGYYRSFLVTRYIDIYITSNGQDVTFDYSWYDSFRLTELLIAIFVAAILISAIVWITKKQKK